MSESDKEGADPSSVSSIPPLLTDDGNSTGSNTGLVYRYRDFSNVGKDDDVAHEGLHDGDMASDNPPAASTSRGSSESSIRVQKFPVKLYAILAQKEFHDIISWMPHGRSWKVLKPSLFENMVMPLFFEYSNYHSFNRLVNAWSFRRISSGPDRGSYYHELFLRGLPHLQKYMRRLPKTHKKQPMSKKDEPDFYALDRAQPLPPLEAAPVPGAAATSAAVRSHQFQLQHSPQSQYTGQPDAHIVTPPQLRPGFASNTGHSPHGVAPRHMMPTRYMGQQPGLDEQYYDPPMVPPQSSSSAYPPHVGMGGPPNTPPGMAHSSYGSFLPPPPAPHRGGPGQMRGGSVGGVRQSPHGLAMDPMMQQPHQQQHYHMDGMQGGNGYGPPGGNGSGYYPQQYPPGPMSQGSGMSYGYDVPHPGMGNYPVGGGVGSGMDQQYQHQQQSGGPNGMRRPVPHRPFVGAD